MTMEPENFIEYLVIEYRWVLVITLLLPLSMLWKIYSNIRNYIVFKLNSAPKQHDKKVKEVQKQVKAWLAGDRFTHLCTARPGWQAMSLRQPLYKNHFTNININLVDILEVDTKKLTVRCEPLATIGQLSATLKQFNLALAVVPELEKLTVGGLVMGTGVESSSHIYGLFQHICEEYELVLADGSVVTCNKDENPDLFYAVPWSYGTLGFLTSVVLKVVPAKKYIRLQYHPYTSLESLSRKFIEETTKENPHQFVEGLLYTKETGVLMLGDMVDEVGTDGKLNRIGAWHAEWFYTQVEKHLKRNKTAVDYIPLRDYYHRHTRSFFWELQHIVKFGNNLIFRYLLGWMMPLEVSLLKLTQPKAVGKLYDKAHIIQDMLVPVDHMEKAVRMFHELLAVYPLWLCPFRVFNNPGQLKINTNQESRMYVDIGIYGVPTAENYDVVEATRRMEKFVIEHNGFQMLCSDTYVTPEQFRQMLDHTLYDKMRDSLPYCKEAFPEIYRKVNRKARK